MAKQTKIIFGCDHGGYKLKGGLMEYVKSLDENYVVEDYGSFNDEASDYPIYAIKVATALQRGLANFGILLCGTGIGMSIMANRFKGIRAAVAYDEYTAKMSRAHNNANILCLGARALDFNLAETITKIWLATPFEGSRHNGRIAFFDQSV